MNKTQQDSAALQFQAQYLDPTSPETLHSLNMLCVRLVFCLYAEDAGIFGKKQQFGDYIKDTPAPQLRRAHQANDRAVMRTYGLPITTSESDTVAHLFKLYEQLTK